MHPAFYYGSAVLVALLLGSLTAWWAVGRGMWGALQRGAWRYYPGYGRSTANPYVRAQAILEGPLVLQRSEAIYLIADRDDRGGLLQPGRNYRIDGGHLDARWWSITVYGDDHHLVHNHRVPSARDSDCSIRARLGRGVRANGRRRRSNSRRGVYTIL